MFWEFVFCFLYSIYFSVNLFCTLKYIKTRYFKDVPSAFYTSDQYDFYETVDNIEKLVLFRRLLNSNEYDFKKGIQQYNKLKKRYIEFIGTDTIQYIFYNLERFCGIETN